MKLHLHVTYSVVHFLRLLWDMGENSRSFTLSNKQLKKAIECRLINSSGSLFVAHACIQQCLVSEISLRYECKQHRTTARYGKSTGGNDQRRPTFAPHNEWYEKEEKGIRKLLPGWWGRFHELMTLHFLLIPIVSFLPNPAIRRCSLAFIRGQYSRCHLIIIFQLHPYRRHFIEKAWRM